MYQPSIKKLMLANIPSVCEIQLSGPHLSTERFHLRVKWSRNGDPFSWPYTGYEEGTDKSTWYPTIALNYKHLTKHQI